MALPTLEIDGITIKPTRQGKYFCPHKCGNHRYPGYPAASWKTEKGIRKHMAECPKSNAGKKLAEQKAEEIAANAAKFVAEHAYQYAPGDTVAFVRRDVIKPRLDSRGRKIRYEDVCRFSAVSISIAEKTWMYNGSAFVAGYLTQAGFVFERDILSSTEEAEKRAIEQQKAHDDHLAFSSFCR